MDNYLKNRENGKDIVKKCMLKLEIAVSVRIMIMMLQYKAITLTLSQHYRTNFKNCN
jgi:hypothetical protein